MSNGDTFDAFPADDGLDREPDLEPEIVLVAMTLDVQRASKLSESRNLWVRGKEVEVKSGYSTGRNKSAIWLAMWGNVRYTAARNPKATAPSADDLRALAVKIQAKIDEHGQAEAAALAAWNRGEARG